MTKIVYLATPDIAVHTLDEIIKNPEIELLGVVTMPDRPAGRGNKMHEPPVKTLALQHNIPVFQTPKISKDEELINTLKNLKPDFFITFAFGQLLSQEVLDIPKNGTINLHASLLPKYRGANPIQWAIINGDKVSGVTTMKTVLKMDAGDMCLTAEIPISENMTVPELVNEISEKSPKLLFDTLKGLTDKTLEPKVQDENEVTFAPKFSKEDGLIDFDITAQEFHNKVRGLQPWPNAYICRDNKNIQILKTQISDMNTQGKKQGEILCINKFGLTVMCKDKAILIELLKPESKGQMNACDFANGKRLKIGDIL